MSGLCPSPLAFCWCPPPTLVTRPASVTNQPCPCHWDGVPTPVTRTRLVSPTLVTQSASGVPSLVTQLVSPSHLGDPVRQWCPHPSDTPRQCHQPMAAQPPVPCHPAVPTNESSCHPPAALLMRPPLTPPPPFSPPTTSLPLLLLPSPQSNNEWSKGRQQLWLDNQFACGHS